MTRRRPRPPRLRRPTAERGYCRLRTSLGDLNLELFASAAPRAVENFVVLAKSGYYDGCVFHRSVRNFCAQSGVRGFFFRSPPFFFLPRAGLFRRRRRRGVGGKGSLLLFPLFVNLDSIRPTQQQQRKKQDPTGTGRGGESVYGGPFPFEGPGAAKSFPGGASGGGGGSKPSASVPDPSHYFHDARGVLAMANSGDRDANGSQFYLLYKSARHLDGKHTVFGHVTEGQDVVNKIAMGDKINTLKIVRVGKKAEAFKGDQADFEKFSK